MVEIGKTVTVSAAYSSFQDVEIKSGNANKIYKIMTTYGGRLIYAGGAKYQVGGVGGGVGWGVGRCKTPSTDMYPEKI